MLLVPTYGMQKNTNLAEILEQLTKRFPGDHMILLVDDMNMSEINWSVPAVKPTFAQKKVDKDFFINAGTVWYEATGYRFHTHSR